MHRKYKNILTSDDQKPLIFDVSRAGSNLSKIEQ